jgi:hypothetical protein
MLAIRITDLRAGYTQISGIGTGYFTRQSLAYKENVSVQQLASHGWANSYGVNYQYRQNPYVMVDNNIDEYNTASGAHWGYTVDLGNTVCCGTRYQRTAAPRVGNESTAYIDRHNPHGFLGVIFRRGRYVVSLDLLPNTKRASLLPLAHMLDRRIQKYG